MKQQQNLYEAVRSDRNLYSKSLIESQEEIAEMKRRFKVMNHQIEQLKEEITSKVSSFSLGMIEVKPKCWCVGPPTGEGTLQPSQGGEGEGAA